MSFYHAGGNPVRFRLGGAVFLCLLTTDHREDAETDLYTLSYPARLALHRVKAVPDRVPTHPTTAPETPARLQTKVGSWM